MKKTFLLLLIFNYSFSFATTYTFTGNGLWSTPANWLGSAVPPANLAAGDRIEIEGTGPCLLDVNVTIRSGVTLQIKTTKSFTVNQNSTLTNHGNITCQGTLANLGTILTDNTIYIADGGNLQNGAAAIIDLLSYGEIFFTAAGTFTNNGAVNLYDILTAGIYLGPVFLHNYGSVNGNGTIEGVTINHSTGTISPGNGSGSLYFSSLTTGGAFTIQLGGLNQNLEHDVITALDNVTINGGTLNISLINGFLPRGSQSFTILLNGAHSGTFSQVNFPVIAGVTWTIEYLSDRVIVHTLSTLPVRFLSFTGRPIRNTIELNWKTAIELNNAGFSIERSENGANWTTIGFKAANGEKAYSFTDQRPSSGINYYRLKQMDSVGNSTFSSIINVRMMKEKWSIYPNPTHNYLWLIGEVGSNPSISIYSISGTLVKKINATSGKIDISNLPSSAYVLQIVNNGEIVHLPFSKN